MKAVYCIFTIYCVRFRPMRVAKRSYLWSLTHRCVENPYYDNRVVLFAYHAYGMHDAIHITPEFFNLIVGTHPCGAFSLVAEPRAVT